ncbi:hypothetical protein [Capnocytophaga catalasegens]|uniref:hypothetical protein n=1 Tax=Capnocytophaga catalasegens TaxID=1004260 RepID=UPI00223129AF|nr:hypothetical protein [Capnocytophaga catalasegens]
MQNTIYRRHALPLHDRKRQIPMQGIFQRLERVKYLCGRFSNDWKESNIYVGGFPTNYL